MNQKYRRQTKRRLKKTEKERTCRKKTPELSQEDFHLQAEQCHIFHTASYNSLSNLF